MNPKTHTIYNLALLTLLTLGVAAKANAAEAAANSTASGGVGAPVLVQPSGPAWPDKVLPAVDFDNVPVREAVSYLRDEFNGQFDMVLPTHWQGEGDVIMPKDWLAMPVSLRLKNLTAPEIFEAMNLYFQVNETPLHWELTQNGNRNVALLHVTAAPLPPVSQEEPKRHIYFVGEMLADGKVYGMTMDQVVGAVTEIYEASFKQSAEKAIQAHKAGELIVVTGSDAEIAFVGEALQALQLKVNLQRANNASAAPAGGVPGEPAK